MITIKPFLAIIASILLSGCYIGEPSYEVFKKNMELQVKYFGPSEYKTNNIRQIYDENRYIYKFKGDDPRCIYGYLTNKDDKPEKVIGWIILSGKENCKETYGFVLIQ